MSIDLFDSLTRAFKLSARTTQKTTQEARSDVVEVSGSLGIYKEKVNEFTNIDMFTL